MTLYRVDPSAFRGVISPPKASDTKQGRRIPTCPLAPSSPCPFDIFNRYDLPPQRANPLEVFFNAQFNDQQSIQFLFDVCGEGGTFVSLPSPGQVREPGKYRERFWRWEDPPVIRLRRVFGLPRTLETGRHLPPRSGAGWDCPGYVGGAARSLIGVPSRMTGRVRRRFESFLLCRLPTPLGWIGKSGLMVA